LRSAPDCRPRRALLHLSYSCATPFGTAILVTQDPEPTERNVSLQCTARGRKLHMMRVEKCDPRHSHGSCASLRWCYNRPSRPR
jgi:hypothetical protein